MRIKQFLSNMAIILVILTAVFAFAIGFSWLCVVGGAIVEKLLPAWVTQ